MLQGVSRRPVLAVAVVFLGGACTGGTKSAPPTTSPVADATVEGPRPVRDALASDQGPEDAAPSTCSPSAACGDGGACWQAPNGAHRCVTFEPQPSYGSGSCSDGGVDPFGRQRPGPCCTKDSDCTEKPRGRCVYNVSCGGQPGPEGRYCDYRGWCTSDKDCSAGTCVPPAISGTEVPVCIAGPCRTSADCKAGPGGACAVSPYRPCEGYQRFYCRYTSDPCGVENQPDACPASKPRCEPAPDGQGRVCAPEPTFPP
jgi:hypothetical protein